MTRDVDLSSSAEDAAGDVTRDVISHVALMARLGPLRVRADARPVQLPTSGSVHACAKGKAYRKLTLSGVQFDAVRPRADRAESIIVCCELGLS